MFYLIPGLHGPSAVALIPKNATQSIKDEAHGSALENKDALRISRRYMFVRHPENRMHINYFFYSRLKAEGRFNAGVTEEALESYESFVDYTFNNVDVHWQPQIEMVMSGEMFVPNRTYKFECINEVWSANFYRPLCHNNHAPEIPGINDHRRDDILRKYRDDLILYMAANTWQ